jgi:opacity protein-like surface antigen
MARLSRCALALLALLAVGATSPAAAGQWVLRAEGGTTDYSKQTFSSHSLGYTELSLDGGQGFGMAAEYRPNRRFGLELSLSSIDLDARSRQVEIRLVSTNPPVVREVTVDSDSGEFSLRPLAAAFLFHPLNQGRLDFYVGPQLAWVDFNIGLRGLQDREAEFAFGGKVGLELELGHSPWAAGVSYRFLETQHDGVEHDQYTGIGIHLVSAVLSYKIR